MAVTPPPMSMRERNRRATLRRLHEAAVELIREGDLAAATVDMIAERAGVSRRTFFNHYASKEDAVLGITAPVVTDAALAAFLDETSGVDRFTRTVELVGTIMRTTREVAGVDPTERRRMLKRFPELLTRLRQHSSATETLAESVLVEHFSTSARDPALAADEARGYLILAHAVMRFAYSRNPAVIDAPDPAAISSAIAAFKVALADVA